MKKTRQEVQFESLQKFKEYRRGTVCLSTGTGKSKVAIDFIKETEDVKLVLITSPRTNLKENWKKELIKWGLEEQSDRNWVVKETGKHLFIVIENIQTTYKWEHEAFDIIIADEVHLMMSPEYSLLFKNNKYKYLLGLTATHDITSKNDKGDYYKKYAPIIYEYYESAEHGLINKTRFVIVNHLLSDERTRKVKINGRTVVMSEADYYQHLTERIKNGQRKMMSMGSDDWFKDAAAWLWEGRGTREQKSAAALYLNSIKARKNFLLNLPSSAEVAKRIKEGILRDIEGSKVLIFSELTAQADMITKNTVHSNKHKDENQRLMDGFDAGEIRDLGSCRSLTLGLNLKGATHAIMESYIGSATQSKQKKGRLDRLDVGDVAEMWIIKVTGTQAENWFEQMVKGFDLEDAEYYDSQIFMNNDSTFNFKQRPDSSDAGSDDSSY